MAPFSTQPQQNAANAQTQGLLAGQGIAQPLLNQGANAIGSGYGQGYQDIQNSYAQGLAPLQQNYATSQQGVGALNNLLGLGGPGGNASALAQLQNMPGYQFTLGQGIQNTDRNQAAMGALNSGNTDKAIADYTTGLAQQNYQNYVGNLQPYLQMAQNTGGQIASTEGQLAGALNANRVGQGQALAGNLGQQAGLGYGTQAGIGNANANAALAPATAGSNFWNLAGNLGKLAVSPSGQNAMQGAGNAVSSLFSNIFAA